MADGVFDGCACEARQGTMKRVCELCLHIEGTMPKFRDVRTRQKFNECGKSEPERQILGDPLSPHGLLWQCLSEAFSVQSGITTTQTLLSSLES